MPTAMQFWLFVKYNEFAASLNIQNLVDFLDLSCKIENTLCKYIRDAKNHLHTNTEIICIATSFNFVICMN